MKKKEKNIVKFALDSNNPPQLSEKQRAELEELAKTPDEAIDYSDIQSLPDEFWKNATCSPLHRPIKQQITMRIDKDVVAWFKAGGKGYQTRINRILRSAMIGEIEEADDKIEAKDNLGRDGHLKPKGRLRGQLVAAKKSCP